MDVTMSIKTSLGTLTLALAMLFGSATSFADKTKRSTLRSF
jgi:hypothetical protein